MIHFVATRWDNAGSVFSESQSLPHPTSSEKRKAEFFRRKKKSSKKESPKASLTELSKEVNQKTSMAASGSGFKAVLPNKIHEAAQLKSLERNNAPAGAVRTKILSKRKQQNRPRQHGPGRRERMQFAQWWKNPQIHSKKVPSPPLTSITVVR